MYITFGVQFIFLFQKFINPLRDSEEGYWMKGRTRSTKFSRGMVWPAVK